MICPNCGVNLPDTAKMCYVCKSTFNNGNSTPSGMSYYDQGINSNPRITQPQQMNFNNPNWNRKPKNSNNGCLSHVLVVIVAFVLLIGWAAVSIKSSKSAEDDEYSTSETVETEYEEAEVETTSETSTEAEVLATVTDSVIYEGNDVKIELKSLDGNTLSFYVENNSTKNLSTSMHAYAINGYMADNNIYDMSNPIAANSKANITFDIPQVLDSGYEVDKIKRMDFLIWFYDDDKSFKDFDTGIITVETSLADGTLDNDIGNEELLNENNISYKLIEKDEDKLVIGINNNSDTYCDFDGKNVVVNGFTLNTDYNLDIFDKVVFPECSYPMTFEYEWSTEADFKKTNGIDKIENVTLNFSVRPNSDYFSETTSSQLSVEY